MDATLWLFGAILVLTGVVDAAAQSRDRFRMVGHSKWLWVAVQVVLPPVGTLIYALTVRPRITAHAET
ncbi:MAG: PLDc N-terminal domain-containing protein [Actinobacteria bacterium]|nr:PLDc N-terminal domain-containing protein [Actinomycetota bacterium]